MVGFTVAVTPEEQTAELGAAATYTVTTAPDGGPFPEEVMLSCTDLPAEATCTFEPASVTLGADTAEATLTVATTKATPTGEAAFRVLGTASTTEASVTVRLVVTAGDFALTVSPTSRTVVPGGSAGYTVTVVAEGASFDCPVSLGCAGLPGGASCSFAPNPVTPGSATATSSLTVSTTTAIAAIPRTAPPGPAEAVVGWAALVLLGVMVPLAPLAGRRRRVGRRVGLVGLLLLVVVLHTNCGDGTAPREPVTFTFDVTGTSGSLSHAATVSLTVQ